MEFETAEQVRKAINDEVTVAGNEVIRNAIDYIKKTGYSAEIKSNNFGSIAEEKYVIDKLKELGYVIKEESSSYDPRDNSTLGFNGYRVSV